MSKPKLLKIFDTITDDVAYSKLNNIVSVTLSNNSLLVSENIQVYDKAILTFKSPCKSSQCTSLSISGTDYTLVTASGGGIISTDALWEAGAMVSVILDCSSNRAYVQNTDVSSLLSKKAPAYTYGTEDLTAGTSALETGKLYFVYE